ncbi:transcription elongation factor S-II-like [Xenia sp. Carnegie-2017]|uniref:transcription elongation factor S-II-like n=1 Tax=Xenia sp. Carnegie-2017 TaxID=2897299 RepID=UPI001F03F7D8|nr:transcription elongation factor S-II-like [Xenia sp. Carnegie-2017]
MNVEHEVAVLAKKLDKIVSDAHSNQDVAVDLLKTLKDLPITLDVLQKTRIGMTVNVLRKSSSNSEIQTISKSLIKSWKKLLTEKESSSKEGANNGEKKEKSGDTKNKTENSIKQEKPKKKSVPTTNDDVRQKCREMLANSLSLANSETSKDVESIAAALEHCIYEEFKDTNAKYKARIRSRVSNLRDPKNEKLREAVLSGEITPERMAKMTAEEMANDEIKTLRKKFTKEAINDAQMAVTAGTPTDLFKCGKCQKRHCTYTQVQTRSADEPMTTFVYCQECGNRWKFC